MRTWSATYRRLRGIERQPLRSRVRLVIAGMIPVAIWVFVLNVIVRRVFPTGAASAIATLVALVAFQMILPLFFVRLLPTKPMDPLTRSRFLSLAARVGVKVRDVRILEARAGKTANAFVMGLTDRTRFVVVTDVLLDTFTPQQVDAVLAHELGHAKGRHLPIKLVVVFGSLLAIGGVAAGIAALAPPGAREGLTGILTLVLFVAWFIFRGKIGMRLEERADDFGADTIGVDAMCGALDRLAEVNASKRKTGRIWNLLTEHPGVEQRIARLRQRAIPQHG